MPDPIFSDPRLATLYDPLDPDRSDLDVYAAIAQEFHAGSVLDVGCGTGVFALMLAARGLDVVGVDPAEASLNVARAKPGAEAVRWIHGDATDVPPLGADLAVMTANVAQVFLSDADWRDTLRAVGKALRPDGRLVFETRDPERRAWQNWSRDHTFSTVEVPGVGPVQSWCEVLDVSPPYVSFRWTYVFKSDGAVLASDSTLRFRDRGEIEASLQECGFVVDELRDAPDRPGRELVFVARRKPSVAHDLAEENGGQA